MRAASALRFLPLAFAPLLAACGASATPAPTSATSVDASSPPDALPSDGASRDGACAGEALLPRPFSAASFWNREVDPTAPLVDVQDAIFGEPADAPTRLVPDFVSLLVTSAAAPSVAFRRSKGWRYPERATPAGDVLYTRKLAPSAGAELRYPRDGNALYAILDPTTGLADEGLGGWREPGGDFLVQQDPAAWHGHDERNGGGDAGGPRASGFSALGGAIRTGEVARGIDHAVAILLSGQRFSKDRHFVAPARSADGSAGDPVVGYKGPNPAYTMGTRLVLPASFDVEATPWRTPHGAAVARATKRFGLYVSDNSVGTEAGRGTFALALERCAARADFGLTVDPATDRLVTDPGTLDAEALTADLLDVLRAVKATR